MTIEDNAPLRLADACRHFSHGAITVSGLRRERDRGNLTTFMIAGKEFTTLKNIKDMIARCAAKEKS